MVNVILCTVLDASDLLGCLGSFSVPRIGLMFDWQASCMILSLFVFVILDYQFMVYFTYLVYSML